MQNQDLFCLDERYSTTRLVITEQPTALQKSKSKVPILLTLAPMKGRKGEGGLRTKGYFKESSKDKPLISIITVVFNGDSFLERTISSVINQCYDNVEYIIIDGGSTDSTLDIIRKYETLLDYWVSEPDMGIYDAMNKAVKLCSGKLLNFLNAGDAYTSEDILHEVYSDYKKNSWKWCYGKQNLININGLTTGTTDPPYFSEKLLRVINFIPHQTVFIERLIFDEYGYFDTDIKLSSDYLFWLRISNKYRPKKISSPTLVNFLEGGAASNPRKVLLDSWKAKNKKLRRSLFVMIIDYLFIHILWLKFSIGIRGVKNHISNFQSRLISRR